MVYIEYVLDTSLSVCLYRHKNKHIRLIYDALAKFSLTAHFLFS